MKHCHWCNEPQERRCPRCRKRGCERHLYGDDRVCAGCDDAFAGEAKKEENDLYWWRVLGAVWCGISIAMLATGLVVVSVALVSGALMVWLGGESYVRRERRRRFMAGGVRRAERTQVVVRLRKDFEVAAEERRRAERWMWIAIAAMLCVGAAIGGVVALR